MFFRVETEVDAPVKAELINLNQHGTSSWDKTKTSEDVNNEEWH